MKKTTEKKSINKKDESKYILYNFSAAHLKAKAAGMELKPTKAHESAINLAQFTKQLEKMFKDLGVPFLVLNEESFQHLISIPRRKNSVLALPPATTHTAKPKQKE